MENLKLTYRTNRRLYWSKVVYPNMEHIKQIGGIRDVKGTSISREIVRAATRGILVLALITALARNRSAIVDYISGAAGTTMQYLYSGARQAQVLLKGG